MVLAVLLLGATRVCSTTRRIGVLGRRGVPGLPAGDRGLLNLLPIPGLDGYGALEPHLSPDTQRALEPVKQWGFFILLIVLLAPPLNQWFFSVVSACSSRSAGLKRLAGVDRRSDLTRFWSA